MKDTNNFDSGLFLKNECAKNLFTLKRNLENLLIKNKYNFLWLPSVTSKKYFHPQNIESNHSNSFLVHAACLPFFEKEKTYENNKYFGFNRVHRLEPMKNFNENTRFESYEVLEIIITGSEEYVEKTYNDTRNILSIFLNKSLNKNIQWRKANDSFIETDINKEEFCVQFENIDVAIASGNKHCKHFSGNESRGVSACFGIGLERVYLIMKKEGCF